VRSAASPDADIGDTATSGLTAVLGCPLLVVTGTPEVARIVVDDARAEGGVKLSVLGAGVVKDVAVGAVVLLVARCGMTSALTAIVVTRAAVPAAAAERRRRRRRCPERCAAARSPSGRGPVAAAARISS
jgi:hypothetical protein